MFSPFAFLFFVIICGTKCWRIVKVCAQSKQHYQGLLSWGLLYQQLVISHCKEEKKKIIMLLDHRLLFVSVEAMLSSFTNPNGTILLSLAPRVQ